MPGRIDFGVSFNRNGSAADRRAGEPMRILLMGNFSGRTGLDAPQRPLSLSSRKIYPVDVDNFDALLSKISPHLSIQTSGQTGLNIELDFKELEDFHPDSLFMRLDLFQSLRDLRSKLLTRETFSQAIEILQGDMKAPQEANPPAATEKETDEATLARLLGKQPAHVGINQAVGKTHTEQLIRAIVRPYIVPTENPLQQTYLDFVDKAISTEMRHLLHNKEYQSLESVWRALHRLVTGLETGEKLELYMLDVTRHELIADLTEAKNNPRQSGLHQLLAEQGFMTHRTCSVIAGDFSFGVGEEELGCLATMGSIASDVGGPFLASASYEVLGASSLSQIGRPEEWTSLGTENEEHWHALRMSPHASWLGLVLPPILLRLPYGAETDEIDSFEFEEIATPMMAPESFLWGSPAYASVMLLALAFVKNGVTMQPGDILDLEDLPAYIYSNAEGKQLMPCTRINLSERAAEAVLERGVMSFLSYRNRNKAHLFQFRSLASQAQSLNGYWA